jgi:hypothetical protein
LAEAGAHRGDDEGVSSLAMMREMLLFPLGVRLSTWLGVLAFVALAGRRRSMLPLVAAWVWLIGFEAAFDSAGLALYGYATDRVLPVVLGVFTLAWSARVRVLRVSRPWAVATVLLWTLWLAIDFRWNSNGWTLGGLPRYDPASDFRWQAEVLNETAKTAWALAYLLPLLTPRSFAWRFDRRSRRSVARSTLTTPTS